MNATFNWYILHTKYSDNTKLARLLFRNGFETYCPQYTDAQNQDLKGTYHQKAVFSSWIFVFCTQEQLQEIKKLNRSIKPLYRLDQPAVISTEEISMIKYALTNFRELQLIKTGLQSTNAPAIMQDDAATVALPSLGLTLVAYEKLENVYQPAWVTEEIVHASPDYGFMKNSRSLLKRLPLFVSSKVMKLSTVLSRAT
jgi:hypothetical protein